MGRHPVDQAPPLRGQDRYWQVIMELAAEKDAFTIRDVWGRTNAAKTDVGDYMRRLVSAGYLAVEPQEGPRAPNLYRLLKTSRRTPSVRADGTVVPPTRRESMWRTMCMLKKFTARDLAVAASTEDVPVRANDARDYLNYLAKAGYVRAQASDGPTVYRLLPSRITGPDAPQVQRVRQVYDPNLDKVVWP